VAVEILAPGIICAENVIYSSLLQNAPELSGKKVGNSQYGGSGKLCGEFLAIWLQNHRVPRILDVALPFNLEQQPAALSRSVD
jgi:hypothetical protein